MEKLIKILEESNNEDKVMDYLLTNGKVKPYSPIYFIPNDNKSTNPYSLSENDQSN